MLASLEAATAEARRLQQPVFAVVHADGCPWCRKLDQQLKTDAVRKELARWTVARLNADKHAADARKLGVSGVPALRILAPTGQILARRDGYVAAEELVAWLTQQYDAARVLPGAGLADDRPPDADALKVLIAALGTGEPLQREAAIARLARHPGPAAGPVVEAFKSGNLAVRLAALEVFREWAAPAEQLDPWQPDSLTPERLAALSEWAAGRASATSASAPAAASAPAELAADRLAAAHADLDALLAADSNVEVDAIRERLARLGRPLLPEVCARLKNAADDRARERLTALRYRLVARPALVLAWPDGLARLAATDARVRHKAAEELAQRAGREDGPLLLELFSDPDPLVREVGLRALRTVGGEQALAALTGLLDDPELNVRAAVLKQLAEKPTSAMLTVLAGYVEREQDPDLVVHAVRVFRAAKGESAVKPLTRLLANPSWRVRAEAAEALGEVLTTSSSLSTSKKADAYVELTKLLRDEDGFVVSRAIKALGNVDVSIAIEPLVQVAVDKPELAPQIMELFTRESLRKKAASQIRILLKHEKAAVRAAAVAVVGALGEKGGALAAAAANDADPQVRLAAARVVPSLLRPQKSRGGSALADDDEEEPASRPTRRRARRSTTAPANAPASGPAATSRPGSPPPSQPAERQPADSRPAEAPPGPASQPAESPSMDSDPASAPAESQPASAPASTSAASRRRDPPPAWTRVIIAPFTAMLADQSADARLAAALALVAAQEYEPATSVLEQIVLGSPELVDAAVAALSWLPADRRPDFFELLRAHRPAGANIEPFLAALTAVADDCAADLLWRLAAADLSEDSAAQVQMALVRTYLGEDYYNAERLTSRMKKRAAAGARPRALAGPELQRVVALGLLSAVDKAAAVEVANALLADSALSPELRRDAFQILLTSLATSRATSRAYDVLGGWDTEQKRVALRFLAMGAEPLRGLRGGRFFSRTTFTVQTSVGSGQRPDLAAPAGLTPELLGPLAMDADPEIAALAAYFRALLGQREALPPLIEYWQAKQSADRHWQRLVYRAIAALNADDQTPVLEEIYTSHQRYEVRELYWTIRGMSGPKILELRKRIRKEVDMNYLR
ncbi:MAG: HEAT repeat domain-containing protein [Planctomycetota bacterium]